MDIALFCLSSLFADDEEVSVDEEKTDISLSYVERRHQFPGMELPIQEFSFHQLNANLHWPGTFTFAEWLVQHQSWIECRRCLELGRKTEENIAHNCKANGIMPVLPHIKLHGETPFQLLIQTGTWS